MSNSLYKQSLCRSRPLYGYHVDFGKIKNGDFLLCFDYLDSVPLKYEFKSNDILTERSDRLIFASLNGVWAKRRVYLLNPIQKSLIPIDLISRFKFWIDNAYRYPTEMSYDLSYKKLEFIVTYYLHNNSFCAFVFSFDVQWLFSLVYIRFYTFALDVSKKVLKNTSDLFTDSVLLDNGVIISWEGLRI